MIKLLLSMILAITFAHASGKKPGHCELSQIGDVKVGWSAYKTPAKLAVSGTFDEVAYRAVAPKGVNFHDIFVGSTLSIDTKSVNSKNSGRDVTLVESFFKQMNSTTIKAKITAIKPNKRVKGKPKTGTWFVDITMNGVSKNVPMTYIYDDGSLVANGFIDILDFSGSKALSAINTACFEHHKGKTWSDVAISFSTGIKALCFPGK